MLTKNDTKIDLWYKKNIFASFFSFFSFTVKLWLPYWEEEEKILFFSTVFFSPDRWRFVSKSSRLIYRARSSSKAQKRRDEKKKKKKKKKRQKVDLAFRFFRALASKHPALWCKRRFGSKNIKVEWCPFLIGHKRLVCRWRRRRLGETRWRRDDEKAAEKKKKDDAFVVVVGRRRRRLVIIKLT